MISIIVIDIVVYHKLQSGSQLSCEMAQNYVTKWLTIMLQSGSQLSCKRCSDRNTDAEPWRESNQEKVR